MKREELLKIAKPILFNTEMIQAILENRKTVTRRLVKPQLMEFQENKTAPWDSINHCRDEVFEFKCRNFTSFYSASYQGGDILYVREKTFGTPGGIDNQDLCYATHCPCGLSDAEHAKAKGWTPSIHMPKAAARIFLKVTDVRVEKLLDLTEEQGLKEGVNSYLEFTNLWNSTIKKKDLDKYGWLANPWVWVIEFERVKI